jgi:hypothetical protein
MVILLISLLSMHILHVLSFFGSQQCWCSTWTHVFSYQTFLYEFHHLSIELCMLCKTHPIGFLIQVKMIPGSDQCDVEYPSLLEDHQVVH